jgi:hypothetical protein
LASQSALALDQQAIMRVFFSVVLVRGYDVDGGLAYGTGVVVGENKVATNCHVLRRTDKVWISQAEDVFKVESVHVDARHDLCLLNTEKLSRHPVSLGNTTDLGKGDEVFAVGHSGGVLAPTTSAGQIKSLYPYEHGNVIRTNARFTLGASGSPLFDGQGRLLGINTFKTPGRAAYFYAVPVEWLAEVEKIPPQTAFPVSGQAFWELPDEEKPFFMQVALPHINEDWQKLWEISSRWVAAEPGNSESWYELGAAQEGLGETEDAIKSYQTSSGLNPSHAEALFRIGVFASQRGDREAMHLVSVTLGRIDSEMAENFNKTVGCESSC